MPHFNFIPINWLIFLYMVSHINYFCFYCSNTHQAPFQQLEKNQKTPWQMYPPVNFFRVFLRPSPVQRPEQRQHLIWLVHQQRGSIRRLRMRLMYCRLVFLDCSKQFCVTAGIRETFSTQQTVSLFLKIDTIY